MACLPARPPGRPSCRQGSGRRASWGCPRRRAGSGRAQCPAPAPTSPERDVRAVPEGVSQLYAEPCLLACCGTCMTAPVRLRTQVEWHGLRAGQGVAVQGVSFFAVLPRLLAHRTALPAASSELARLHRLQPRRDTQSDSVGGLAADLAGMAGLGASLALGRVGAVHVVPGRGHRLCGRRSTHAEGGAAWGAAGALIVRGVGGLRTGGGPGQASHACDCWETRSCFCAHCVAIRLVAGCLHCRRPADEAGS